MGKIESFKKAVAAGKASVLGSLKARTTADDLADAKAQLADELTAAQERVVELDAARKAALFEAPEKVEGLTRDLAECRDNIELIGAAIEGVGSRLAAAEHAERMAKIEARMKEVREGAQVNLRNRLKDYHRLATDLAAALKDIEALEKQVVAANSDAKAQGRPDLTMKSVYTDLTAKRQAAFDKFYHAQGPRRPANAPPPVASPVQRGAFDLTAVQLPGYYPAPPKSDKPFHAPPLSFIE